MPMPLTAALVYAALAGAVLSQDPTCGHCRCHVIYDDPLSALPLTNPVLLVNCSDDRYFPGQLRAPKLTADDAALPVWAEFNRNSYTHVGDNFILEDTVSLFLEDNEIRNISSRAFSSFRTLLHLSLAKNHLETVDAEMFHGLGNLLELDLSYNLLVLIMDGTFAELKSLTTLRIAGNKIRAVGPKFFQGLENLQTVDVSLNEISDLSPVTFSHIPLLEHLMLSGNIITDVGEDPFANLKQLKSVDLSKNAISNLTTDLLKNQKSLQKLVLSGNSLTTAISLPSTVTYLDLTDNHVQGVQDMWKALENLEELHVANTSIMNLDGSFNFKNLQVINMSQNFLAYFQIESLPKLKILDLSSNNMSSIPEGVTAVKLPSLQELYLDGNPIEELVFPPSEVVFQNLRVFSLSGDTELQTVGPDVFADVTAKLTKLRLSHNPTLAAVHEQAFKDVDIGELDLSWNALSSLPKDLVSWEQLLSVDLQHNPWDCECSLQWLLDVVVSKLYATNQHLLYELRCASPAALRDRRMVHFYNWTQKAFCMQFEQLRMNPLDTDESPDMAAFGSSTTAIIVVLSLLAALIVMVVVGVLLQRRISSRRRLRNRRF